MYVCICVCKYAYMHTCVRVCACLEMQPMLGLHTGKRPAHENEFHAEGMGCFRHRTLAL